MATIKDIANRLGVSVSTVSKGLNGASDISDELRRNAFCLKPRTMSYPNSSIVS